ncbi:hypothetical protein DQ04_02481010 [Trypanosoma grayi]|uniref:hypothetical protein n=1 Tax=Trypanosoma grayi TaxID=71804 RepID=UPI0004F47C86|nr:hypothetical protein DQ04_02481010 [Trypanosoma grayi]KEG11566.1 hypothetical protein DQ04_02481010 [Trypanosoma grayi]
MDNLLEILRTTTDNEQRKRATAQLRQAQESNPEAFLMCTWEGVSSSTVAAEVRFFLASAVVEFVEQSWRNVVPKKLQHEMIDRYLQVLLREKLPSLSLARKVALVLSVMVKRCDVKAMPGELPAPMERSASMLADAAVQAAGCMTPTSMDFATQCLLALHVFLKEARRKRIGGVFPKLCLLLVPVMSTLFASSAAWDHVECYLPLLYLLKCALRVFGFGVFEPSFYPYLLDITWRLAQAVTAPGQQQQQLQYRQRLLEYAVKVQAKMVAVFPSRLQELSLAFFVAQEGAAERDMSLFTLLDAIIASPLEAVATEKMVCRSMRLFTTLLAVEDADPFTATCLTALANSPQLHRLLERVIMLLADDTGAATLREWDVDAERYAAEFDVDMDDENSVTCCAEELLLALTGSTVCAARSLEVAWQIVNAFLTAGDMAHVTAGLHAIGTCYYTMSVGQDPASYLSFLTGKLLPLIGAAAHTSPFVVRRVVWIVGMWCESVQDPSMRREVHAAFASLMAPTTCTVVLLTTLRAIGNFINDVSFTREEVTPAYVHDVLLTIQRTLPLLHTPSAVKGLSGLVHSMIEHGVLDVGSGEMLLDVLLPAVYRIISETQAAVSATGDDEVAEVDAGSLGMLLECVGSCAGITPPDLEDRVWSLFAAVVVPCTVPGGKLTLWAEDYAWELLLTMCRAARTWTPAKRDALAWCFENMMRDTALLHLVVRCAYTLLLLCPQPAEILDAQLADHAVTVLTQTPSAELSLAYFALLGVMVRLGDATLRCHLLKTALQQLLSADSVQSDTYSVRLGVLVAWCLPPHCNDSALEALGGGIMQHPNGASFAERVVLLLDVSPSYLVTEKLLTLLRLLRERLPQLLNVEDARMVQCAIEESAPEQRQQQQLEAPREEDDLDGTRRSSAEMLLELFGDEQLLGSSPHVLRLTSVFGVPSSS